VSPDLVSTVDLGGWFHGDQAARAVVVAKVDAECRRIGFLRISGHGVAPDLIERMRAVTTAFFDRPEGEKARYLITDKARNRGYTAFGTEALAYSLGVDSPPDLFEAFNCGVEQVDEGDPYIAAERHRLFAANVWPVAPSDMRDVWLEYFAAVQGLARQLMIIFATALGMPEMFLLDRSDRSPDVMRANNYERRAGHGEPRPGQVRMGAHTDYGVCTILLADAVPGLEIVGPDGAWHGVLPEADTFLVNLGDLLAEWTNDRWRSTLHRVMPPPTAVTGVVRRRSIAYFHEANYDTVVTVMPTCVDADHPAKYPAITAGQHLLNKLMGPRTMAPSVADQTSVGDRLSTIRRPMSP
jgi:isopenicillin N synthase-like dioxygenase